jgi:hypothetical protein
MHYNKKNCHSLQGSTKLSPVDHDAPDYGSGTKSAVITKNQKRKLLMHGTLKD